MATLEFWYEFASPYSYLSAMRIETLAAAYGVDIVWKPFLLGPIFKAQGLLIRPQSVGQCAERKLRQVQFVPSIAVLLCHQVLFDAFLLVQDSLASMLATTIPPGCCSF